MTDEPDQPRNRPDCRDSGNKDLPIGPHEVRLEWLEEAISMTKAYIQIERVESQTELHWSAPGSRDYDYNTDLLIAIDQAERTLEALEVERKLILGQVELRKVQAAEGKYRDG